MMPRSFSLCPDLADPSPCLDFHINDKEKDRGGLVGLSTGFPTIPSTKSFGANV